MHMSLTAEAVHNGVREGSPSRLQLNRRGSNRMSLKIDRPVMLDSYENEFLEE